VSDWSEAISDLNALAVSVDVFGEPCTLPGGEVLGIFHPRGNPTEPLSSEVGLSMRMSQQRSPMLVLLEGDAADLSDGDAVTVKGQAYLVTRVDPPEHELARVWLMPDVTDAGSPPDTERWR